MTIFDYIVIAVVVLSVILGLFRGMVKEVLSLANWVLAFWVANR
ncbi:CvpA family protein, partial [Vibrio parahaemolyticus]